MARSMKTGTLAGDNCDDPSISVSSRGSLYTTTEIPRSVTMPHSHDPPTHPKIRETPSERNIFTVGDFTPTHGQVGTVIAVSLTFNVQVQGTIFIRLVAGSELLETTVSRTQQHDRDWCIQAMMPPCDGVAGNAAAIPVTVQLLLDEKLLDLASCGHFAYIAPGKSFLILQLFAADLAFPIVDYERRVPPHQYPVKTELDDRLASGPSGVIRSKPPSRPSGTVSRGRPPRNIGSSRNVSSPDPPSIVRRNGRFHSCARRSTSHGFVRVPRYAEKEGESLSLQFMTSLEDLCQSWDSDELRANRRLVKFTVLREGSRIMLHAERVSQQDYSPEDDIVISCIRHQESSSFHVTSVDILSLFQAICGQELSVKEKTRLRRNIQCFSPIRLSKTDCEFTSFYYTIMEMKNPKPRTIDKKLKVFNWLLLNDMLDKMLSKFVSCNS